MAAGNRADSDLRRVSEPAGFAKADPRPTFRGTKAKKENTMSVARVTEISATSPTSFDDAVKNGIERAGKTLRGMTSAWVKDQNIDIQDGKVASFRVNLAVTFVLDD